MKVYIAAPLFNEMELERNLTINKMLESLGFDTYLPQRDGGVFYDLRRNGLSEIEAKKQIFAFDYDGIVNSDVILCLLDGRTLDEGMCFELGIGYALKKICIGYKTDYRTQDRFGDNIMLEGALSKIFRTNSELIGYLNALLISSNAAIECF